MRCQEKGWLLWPMLKLIHMTSALIESWIQLKWWKLKTWAVVEKNWTRKNQLCMKMFSIYLVQRIGGKFLRFLAISRAWEAPRNPKFSQKSLPSPKTKPNTKKPQKSSKFKFFTLLFSFLSAPTAKASLYNIYNQTLILDQEIELLKYDLNLFDQPEKYSPGDFLLYFNTIIDGYGCWCNFKNNGQIKGKGKPVDEIDGVCRLLHDGYKCSVVDSLEEFMVKEDGEIQLDSSKTGDNLAQLQLCQPHRVDYSPGILSNGFSNLNVQNPVEKLTIESCGGVKMWGFGSHWGHFFCTKCHKFLTSLSNVALKIQIIRALIAPVWSKEIWY